MNPPSSSSPEMSPSFRTAMPTTMSNSKRGIRPFPNYEINAKIKARDLSHPDKKWLLGLACFLNRMPESTTVPSWEPGLGSLNPSVTGLYEASFTSFRRNRNSDEACCDGHFSFALWMKHLQASAVADAVLPYLRQIADLVIALKHQFAGFAK
jgi:hypothetical protein